MASDVRKDTTDVYRYKITTTGVTKPSRWVQNPEPAKPFENVTFRGYYQNKQSWIPWRHKGDTITLELQQLEASIHVDELSGPEPALEWVTIRTKTYGGEEEGDE